MSKEVIWHAPLYDPSGYASCAREYVLALHRLGVKVRTQPMSYWSMIRGAISDEQERLLRALENTPVSQYATRVQHTVPDCYHKDRGFDKRKNNIGYTVFETSSIPEHWAIKMNMMNKIFIPCQFNLETFERGGVDPKKMVVIPHIFDTDKMDPAKFEPMPITPKKDFYFLTIMDFTKRKGWDILLKAYLREFKGQRDVGLIFKAYFGGTTDEHKKHLIRKLKNFKSSLQIKNAPDIIFFGDILEEMFLYKLYRAANCFVLPIRGGGFELTLGESLSLEIPIITTNWSGQLEFCKPDNSYLIDVLGFEETDEDMIKITPNYKGQKWATPSEAHLRQLMRHVYDNYSEAKEKAKRGRKLLQENFNWNIVGKKIIDNI